MDTKKLLERVLDDAGQDVAAALAALEDGEYLAKLGLTDDDTAAVEEAHSTLSDVIGTHAEPVTYDG